MAVIIKSECTFNRQKLSPTVVKVTNLLKRIKSRLKTKNNELKFSVKNGVLSKNAIFQRKFLCLNA
jgi:hypothetical protein